jgi:hypothetical protein
MIDQAYVPRSWGGNRAKRKERHPGPVCFIGEYRESETRGRSGHGLMSLPETLEMIGPSIPGIYKPFSIY